MAAASSGHVLYPAWLAFASRRRPLAPVSDPVRWPAVTVLVAAYAEAECIGPKVRDVLANGYPGPLDVMVVADADVETAARAEHAGATVVTADDRLGKAQAINLGMSKVTSPDRGADRRQQRACRVVPSRPWSGISRIPAWVRWPARRWRPTAAVKISTGASSPGSNNANGGSARPSGSWASSPLSAPTPGAPFPSTSPPTTCGSRSTCPSAVTSVAYEPSAKAFEPPVHTFRQQWERRTRSVSAGLHVFQRRRSQLGPKGGLVSAEIWGHRLARYTVSPVAHVALVGVALRRARSQPVG